MRSPDVLWSGNNRKTYLWLLHTAGLIAKVSVHFWDAGGCWDEEVTFLMAVHVFAKAGRAGGGEWLSTDGGELGLVSERLRFSTFLLPGINNSGTLEAILEMHSFFSGSTAEQNGGEPN